jgi:cardiolipin synthase A/B
MAELLVSPWLDNLLLAAYVLAALVAAGHAILNKRDPRSAWGWIAVCWLFPLAGPLLYVTFGINRIQLAPLRSVVPQPATVEQAALPQLVNVHPADVQELARIGAAMSGLPLAAGNRIEPLFNGDEAYPAMLAAIGAARRSVCLATYIYRDDAAGQTFATALAAAQARGVTVRVLLDGLADVFYRPRASRLLRRHGIKPALFLPPRLLPPMIHLNLRNHRKLLVVDGELAFTGGINIDDRHRLQGNGDGGIQDLHFRVRGPVVHQLQEVFAADWRFATGEEIAADPAPPSPGQGATAARVIRDGPNDELNRLELVLEGALAAAHRRVWIMTPYFLPRSSLLGALQGAALRGLDVQVLLPERSDQPWMDWATRHLLWQLLQHHVRVFYRPPPFAHTKLILMDDYYLQFGTANLDSRSMRLNFELMVEAYDPALQAVLSRHFMDARAACRPVALADVDSRPLAAQLRDGFFWLFSPFL